MIDDSYIRTGRDLETRTRQAYFGAYLIARKGRESFHIGGDSFSDISVGSGRAIDIAGGVASHNFSSYYSEKYFVIDGASTSDFFPDHYFSINNKSSFKADFTNVRDSSGNLDSRFLSRWTIQSLNPEATTDGGSYNVLNYGAIIENTEIHDLRPIVSLPIPIEETYRDELGAFHPDFIDIADCTFLVSNRFSTRYNIEGNFLVQRIVSSVGEIRLIIDARNSETSIRTVLNSSIKNGVWISEDMTNDFFPVLVGVLQRIVVVIIVERRDESGEWVELSSILSESGESLDTDLCGEQGFVLETCLRSGDLWGFEAGAGDPQAGSTQRFRRRTYSPAEPDNFTPDPNIIYEDFSGYEEIDTDTGNHQHIITNMGNLVANSPNVILALDRDNNSINHFGKDTALNNIIRNSHAETGRTYINSSSLSASADITRSVVQVVAGDGTNDAYSAVITPNTSLPASTPTSLTYSASFSIER